MTDSVLQVSFWHWWILGLVLCGLEMLVPGTIILWLGIAAGLTGMALAIAPTLSWEFQILLFASLSVISLLAWRFYQKRRPPETDDATLNRRGAQYVGRVFTLQQAIVNGRGAVQVGDSLWRAEGPDLPAGAKVTVIAVAGTALQVERTADERPSLPS
jgi:inner membrane protein